MQNEKNFVCSVHASKKASYPAQNLFFKLANFLSGFYSSLEDKLTRFAQDRLKKTV